MNASIIILIGGQSKRMGQPKYALQFGEETLLQRVVGNVKGPGAMIVVAAPDQELPNLGDAVIVRDPMPDQGPLLGITTGLKEAAKIGTDAFVIGCDMPFVMRRHLQLLLSHKNASDDIVMPKIDGQFYPLCALYQTHIWTVGQSLLHSGQRRLLSLVDHCRIHPVDEATLLVGEPDLKFLTNVNTPETYQQALELANLQG